MSAKRDKTRSTYFVAGPKPGVWGTPHPSFFAATDGYLTRKSWTVCEHLSSPEKAMSYQQESSPILIVHGFILCRACNNRNILTGQDGFNTMLRFSSPHDDSFFQRFIMGEDASDDYSSWVKLLSGSEDESEKNRHVCTHLNTDEKLYAHYASRKILFWHQDMLLCASCLEELGNGEKSSVEESGLLLRGRSFSEKIVAPLCLINEEYFGLRG